jgi:hypothetical protein
MSCYFSVRKGDSMNRMRVPLLANITGDARYTALLRKMKLPEG